MSFGIFFLTAIYIFMVTRVTVQKVLILVVCTQLTNSSYQHFLLFYTRSLLPTVASLVSFVGKFALFQKQKFSSP